MNEIKKEPQKQKKEKVRGELDYEMTIDLETGQFHPMFPKPKNERQGHLTTIASMMFCFQLIQATANASKSKLIITGNERQIYEAEIALKVLRGFIESSGGRYLASKNPVNTPKAEEKAEPNKEEVKTEESKDETKTDGDNPSTEMKIVE
jgi:hypothetical protein